METSERVTIMAQNNDDEAELTRLKTAHYKDLQNEARIKVFRKPFELAGFKFGSKKMNIKEPPKSAHTKEKNTLLKIVIGMAVSKYKHDPKKQRTDTVSQIQHDLDLLGINLDADTIREWLKKSEKFLPK